MAEFWAAYSPALVLEGQDGLAHTWVVSRQSGRAEPTKDRRCCILPPRSCQRLRLHPFGPRNKHFFCRANTKATHTRCELVLCFVCAASAYQPSHLANDRQPPLPHLQRRGWAARTAACSAASTPYAACDLCCHHTLKSYPNVYTT